MDNNVSDFKLAESIIRKLCRKYEVPFIDVPVVFDDMIGNALSIQDSKNIAQTIFKVVGEYINRSFEITGIQFLPDESVKDNFLITLATNLRSFIYSEEEHGDVPDESYALRLYQYPLIWILMKDIICPIYNKELTNIKLIIADSSEIDIAKYHKQEDISDESFIFINRINNRVVQNAFIFMEVLRAYELSPIEVVKDIYETDLYDKFCGLLEIALDNDDEVNDFKCTILAILSVNFYGLISKKIAQLNTKFVKVAQNASSETPNQFWFFGLLEKMMETKRTSDWSVYENLEPYIKELWDKVEAVRKIRIKNGHDNGVPFDVLLRIKSKQTVGYEIDPTRTIQELLSSNRVW